jgi:hypothetical protein
MTITLAHGVAEVAVSRLLAADPPIVWAEPTPSAERILGTKGFRGLWVGDSSELATFVTSGVQLDELKGYWPTGSIHVVGKKWSVFWASETQPEWANKWLAVHETTHALITYEVPCADEADMLTIRDHHRYGLPAFAPERVTVRAYRHGTTTAFWTLTVKESK